MLRVRLGTYLCYCPFSQEGMKGTSSNTACDRGPHVPGSQVQDPAGWHRRGHGQCTGTAGELGSPLRGLRGCCRPPPPPGFLWVAHAAATSQPLKNPVR